MEIKRIISEAAQLQLDLLQQPELIKEIQLTVDCMTECYRKGGKVLFCGNGGSAADAQHLAAELSGRFSFDRPPLFAEALHVNTSFVTAVANDYSFDMVFSRMVEAMGRKGDVLVGISTSGNAANVVAAMETAHKLGMKTIGLTGNKQGKMITLADHLLEVPSAQTARIQEAHILIGHIICELVEKALFGSQTT